MAEDEWDDLHKETFDRTGYWGESAAGCIFLSRNTGRLLLARRSEEVLEPLTWGTWGGAIDPGETPLEAAMREAEKEAGHRVSEADAVLLWVYRDEAADFSYYTYLVPTEREFTPIMGWETEEAGWFPVGDWPQPMHYGLAALLAAPEAMATLEEALERLAPTDTPSMDPRNG